jgi:hypothetical protein
MADDLERRVRENFEFSMELAERIFDSAGDDGNDALMKAVGTLAQVIYFGAMEDSREKIVAEAVKSLGLYIEMLDGMETTGAILERAR